MVFGRPPPMQVLKSPQFVFARIMRIFGVKPFSESDCRQVGAKSKTFVAEFFATLFDRASQSKQIKWTMGCRPLIFFP